MKNRHRLALVAAIALASAPAFFSSTASADSTYIGPAAGNWSNAANWSNSTVPNSGTAVVLIDGGNAQNSTVTVDSNFTVQDLTVDAGDILNFADNNTTLTINGGNITNNGSINMTSVNNFVNIGIAGNVTLNGSGVLTLQNFARITDAGAGILINNSTIEGFTIVNGGNLGNNNIGIVNGVAGVIDANVTGQTLVVDPAANKGAFVNQGLLEATNGGNLQLTGSNGGGFDNTGGAILATGANSTVSFTAGAAITNGTLSGQSGGLILFQSASLADVLLSGDAAIANSGSVVLSGNITNNANFSLASTANFADLFISGNVLLDGNGTLSLQNFARVRDGGSGVLTIGANQTVQGSTNFNGGGTFGNNDLGIVNLGTINANIAGQTLFIDPAANKGELVNHGLMEATNGATLQLTGSNGGSFTNTGASILASGANSTVLLTTNAIVTGGSLTGSSGGTIELSSASLSNLTLSGNILQDNGANVVWSGTITNNGAYLLNSSVNFTDVLISGNVTLDGNGTVTMQNFARFRDSSDGILTIGANQTIQGSTNVAGGGSLGTNNIGIVNLGTINANVPGQALLVDPAANKGEFVNNGLMEATNGGTLLLSGSNSGRFDNTAGTINATGAGSLVQLATGAAVTGGSINAGSGASIEFSSASLANVILSGNSTVDNGTTLFLTGTLTNNGNLLVNSTSTYADLAITGNVTIDGNGTVTMQNFARFRDNGSGILTIGAHQTIDGSTNSSGGGSLGNNNIGIVNLGTINANVANQSLLVDPASDRGSFINQGLMQATNGGILLLSGVNGGGFDNTAGTINAAGTASLVQLASGAAVTGGSINAAPGASIEFSSASLANVILSGNSTVDNGTTLFLTGTLTNNGNLLVNSTSTYADLAITGNVTIDGNGTITLQNYSRFRDNGNGILTIGANQTLQGWSNLGGGSLGSNNIGIINLGTINANFAGQSLLVDPAADKGAFLNAPSGIARASNGGTLLLTGSNGGAFTNNGTFEALDASALTMDANAVLTNDNSGTLANGTYRALSTGNGATLFLQGTPISTLAPDTTIELNGLNSLIQFGSTSIDTSLNTNNGSLLILANRNFLANQPFTNNHLLQLGGGTFTENALNNTANATILGFGTVTNLPTNLGLIQASGGTLTFSSGVAGATGSTLQSDANATLDLSPSSSPSSTATLNLLGNLALGNNNLSVSSSYTNAHFGIGDAFNKHANVSFTSGLLLANGDNTESLSNTTLDFHNVHVGDSNSLTYTITNAGSTGPAVLFAIQPTANGGSISDARLSGSGVTSSNVGPLNIGTTSSPLTVTFNATSAGALTGQSVHIDNNFDNLAPQSLSILGAAYRYAAPSNATPNPVNFGNHHVGDVVGPVDIAISNNVPNDGFSEKLNASLSNNTSSGANLSGSFNLLPAGSSLPAAFSASLDTSSAGHKSASATINFVSDGNGTSGLGQTPLSLLSQSLSASGNVYRFAAPSSASPNPVNFGNHHVGDSLSANIALGNTAPNDGFSEALDASLSNATNNGVSFSGGFTLLSANNSLPNAFTASLNTSSAGNKSGSITANLVSDGANTSGLGNTTLISQLLTANGAVFRFAAPALNSPSSYNLGTVHVGDAVTRNPSFSNTAPDDGFSETLRVNISSHTGNVSTTTGSSNGLVAPNASNTGFVTITLDTSSAQLGRTGSQTFHFQSDGSNPLHLPSESDNGLGISDLAGQDQSISITADVLNYAAPQLAKHAGNGSLSSSSSTHYTLDFGTLTAGDSVNALLDILNAAIGPADTLGGSWTNNAPDFTITGLGNFSGIAAGNSASGPNISFTAPNANETLTEHLTLTPLSSDAAGDFPLSAITLDITANITTIPEPTALSRLASATTLLRLKSRRPH
ncbi:MAG: beta strand repeat-containing protein [Phycisphaerae bacterium]